MSVRAEKKEKVRELAEKMSHCSSLVLTDYRGLNVAEMTELRRQLREEGVEFKVVKNTLLRRAARDSDLSELEPYLVGPTAVAFGDEDPVSPAKVLVRFSKGNEELEIKCGLLDGEMLGVEDVRQLGQLPSREELLGQTAGVLVAPVRNLLYLLQAPVQNFVYGLNALREQRS